MDHHDTLLPRRARRRWRAVLAAGAALALVVACGGEDDGTTSDDAADDAAASATDASTEQDTGTDDASATGTADDGTSDDGADRGAFPVTVSGDDGEVEVPARPESIVSISPTGTEILFAIGAGDQVVAVDSFSSFPDEAPVTDLSAFEPSAEAIAEFEPDLVVASGPSEAVDALRELDVPVVVQSAPADLDGMYAQFEVLGAATGHLGDAAEVVAQIRSDIDAAVADAAEATAGAAGLTYYHELSPDLFTATSETFIGAVYGQFGLVNVADTADGAAEAGGFPQLSPEFVIEADPDLVFVTDCCDVDAEALAARDGWADLTALPDGVTVLDSDIASRWGPRVVDLVELVGEAVASAPALAGAATDG